MSLHPSPSRLFAATGCSGSARAGLFPTAPRITPMPSGHSLSCNSGSTASAVFRWLPLVKWLPAIPHYVLLVFLWIVAVLAVIIRGRRRDFGATRCHPTISKVGADGHRQQRCAPDGD